MKKRKHFFKGMTKNADLDKISITKQKDKKGIVFSRLESFIKSHPLRVSILSAFTSLLIVTVIIIVSYIYYSNSKEMLNISDQFFNQVTETVIEKTTNYLKPASILVDMNPLHTQKTRHNISNDQDLFVGNWFFISQLILQF